MREPSAAGPPRSCEGAIEAVKTGLLDESLIDDAVARILALKFRLGLFEDPRLPDAERIKAVIGSAEHQQTNLELARESVALLRNDGALPFAANKAKRIAVVGPLADDAQNQLGDWTGNSGQVSWMPDGQPRGMITTVLDGLTQLTSDDCEVVYSRGANVIDLVPDPAGEFYPDGQPRPKIGVSAAVDRAMIDEAVANARQSDLIVAVVGDVVQLVGETCSTATLELLGGQNALLDALAAVSPTSVKPPSCGSAKPASRWSPCSSAPSRRCCPPPSWASPVYSPSASATLKPAPAPSCGRRTRACAAVRPSPK